VKKVSLWLGLGTAVLFFLGVVGLVLGLVMPGGLTPPESIPTGGKSPLSEIRKKSDLLSKQLADLLERPAFPGANPLPHRVFVSRTLLFLPNEKESVQALRSDLVTSDGINVGWKIQHGFDLEDPNLAGQDDDSDGFSNKEEFDKGTDPNDSSSSPSKWVKIKIAAFDTNSLGLGLSGKSSDRYTLRLALSGKKKDVDVVVGDQLWLAVSSKGVDIGKSESEWEKIKEAGACPHAIPILIKGYHEEKGKRMDEKTKTENDFDDSYLEIERSDGISGLFKILIDERGKSRGVNWSVGDIRLVSLRPGEGEMGPYRVGQLFSYAGKDFVIRDATPSKVSLKMQPEGEEVQILPKTP